MHPRFHKLKVNLSLSPNIKRTGAIMAQGDGTSLSQLVEKLLIREAQRRIEE